MPYTVESVIEDVREIPEGVKMIKAPEIWDDSRKGSGVVVAILDTGCDSKHPDLKGRIIEGKNFTDQGSKDDFSDINIHGTHVAGTIGAVINGEGVIGVAPEVNLMILRIFKEEEIITEDGKREKAIVANNEDIIKAIEYCIQWRGTNQERVRVINMSLGGPSDDPKLHDVIKKAVNHDILVVCAAGNEGDIRDGGDCSPVRDELSYPGAYSEVVEVGAVGLDKKFPCFTNTNLELDLVAPGVNILSTIPRERHAHLSGTSMAAPHVAGAAALIINQCEEDFGRTITEAEVYAQLIKRTVPLGNSKKIEGNGLLVLTEE
ncbi:S8 family peptidase [Bacillus thuringiensis]|uniref:S8 family peptidase n=1 Tax=Bacillus thuringiensis TaxID=1428 RepID=UPI00370976C3